MNYNNSDDERSNNIQSDNQNNNNNTSSSDNSSQIGYNNVSYSPTTGFYSQQNYDPYRKSSFSKKKRSHTGLIVFSCLLGLFLAVVLIGVAAFGILNSELGQLFSMNVQNWVDQKNDDSLPDRTPPDTSDTGSLPSADNNTFTPVDNPPTIDIVSVKNREIEKIYDESGREILGIPEIVERVSPCVVGIVNTQVVNMMTSVGIGSGIIFSNDGFILTNQHVVDGAVNLTVYLNDGTEYNASVIGEDSKADIAVIKIEASNLPIAEFGDSDTLRIGDLAVAIGNPASLDLQGTTTSGIISALNREIMIDNSGRTLDLIQTDAAINPGNSGGPLINKYGQVIGINTIKLSTSSYEGICFAIPSNTVKPIIDDLLAFGYVKGYPSIGIEGYPIGTYEAKAYSIPVGVLISSVNEESNAHKAGLKVYDVITHCEGEAVYTIADINVIKNKMNVGDTITLTVYREGKTFDIGIELMDEADLSD